jgi:cobalamin biosynthetic protein CobC
LLEHGGRLRQAAKRYAIPLIDWVDLSTGINPNGWPIPSIPAQCWQRLPEDDDELMAAAHTYYQNNSLLPVAGSQAAIQSLPLLRPACRVGFLHPAYAEHAASWQKTGHQLQLLNAEKISNELDKLDVLILINPNNPTGKLWQPAQLLEWHARLSHRGGWLIVDEAFMDGMPEYSLSAQPVRPGLIVLRSIGKFFGLAGIRCGFVIAEHSILRILNEFLGPWTISNPGRYVAAKALLDKAWQHQTALDLTQNSQRLQQLLTESGLPPDGGCSLFQWLKTDAAGQLHDHLAQQGIYTRLFHEPDSLRFGLPKDEAGWQRLKEALRQFNRRYSFDDELACTENTSQLG